MIFVLSIFTVLLFHIGRHTKSNIYLAIYFLSQIIVLFCFIIKPSDNILYILGRSVCFTWGTLFYMFACSLFNPDYKFKLKTNVHFIPFIIIFILSVYKIKANNFSYQNIPFYLSNNFTNYIFNTLIISYNLVVIYLYFKHKSKLKSNVSSTIWIKVSVFGFSISCFFVQFGHFLKIPTHFQFVIGNISFLLYFSVLFYLAIVNRTITDKYGIIKKYKNSSLDENECLEILHKIETYMNAEKPFINPELNLRNLSLVLNIQEKYISETINKLKNQNFSEFINSYRVSYSMELLKNPEYDEKKMIYILYESGFNSKTTFNNCFKRITGVTPIEYKKLLK
jgi:AraC-like DNA-binding protein